MKGELKNELNSEWFVGVNGVYVRLNCEMTAFIASRVVD